MTARFARDESRSATANQSEFKRNFTRVPLDRPRTTSVRAKTIQLYGIRTAGRQGNHGCSVQLNGPFFVRNSRRTHVARNTYEGLDNQLRGIKIIVFNKRQHWTVHARYRGTYIDVCRNEYFPSVFSRNSKRVYQVVSKKRCTREPSCEILYVEPEKK